MTAPLIDCARCGLSFARPGRRGPMPQVCSECPPLRTHTTMDSSLPGYRLAFAFATVTYRLAIEQATALLRLGQTTRALEILESVEAPARSAARRVNNRMPLQRRAS